MKDAESAEGLYDAALVDVAADAAANDGLVEAVLSESRRYGLPVILLAAAGQMGAGADGQRVRLASKPCSAAELAQTVLAATGAVNAKRQGREPATQEAELGPLHVLLAEDGPVNQEVAVGLLEIAGFTVCVANNGREAVEAFEQGAFDAVLMDLEMPEIDGFEAARRIREHEAATNRRTPIIAMTAHAVTGFRERCVQSGMDGYVTKPINLQELLHELRSVLKTSLAPATPIASVPAPIRA
jgi:CheY-like chemotaxis protein